MSRVDTNRVKPRLIDTTTSLLITAMILFITSLTWLHALLRSSDSSRLLFSPLLLVDGWMMLAKKSAKTVCLSVCPSVRHAKMICQFTAFQWCMLTTNHVFIGTKCKKLHTLVTFTMLSWDIYQKLRNDSMASEKPVFLRVHGAGLHCTRCSPVIMWPPITDPTLLTSN